MNTMDTIKSRKSVRSYTGGQISEDELQTVLTAANASPVGMGQYENVQLTVIQNPSVLQALDAAGAAFFGKPGLHPLYGAPTLVLVSGKKPAPGMENITYSNAAMIVQNMALAAAELGIGACCIWGAVLALKQNPELLERLALPEGFIPCGSLILGKTEEKYVPREIPGDRIKTVKIV